ncbi:MAG: Flp pilus assembly complex ATPase component TadA [Candidatus Omnitrophica bacterium]|nr:Flp pilus assembly complex ATPase component TadA [Candidatus Omnitrophota bacterium]
MKYIEISHKYEPTRSIPLTDGVLTIGSLSTSDIVLDSPGILPEHARIVKDAKHFAILSLSKKDDVTVNDRVIQSAVLSTEDAIKIKGYALRFVDAKEEKTGSFYLNLKQSMHSSLIEKIEQEQIRVEEIGEEELWNKCSTIIDGIISAKHLPKNIEPDKLKNDILNEALRLGPLESLLADDTITEIMVNNKDRIFIERSGMLEETGLSFTSDEHVINIISRIVAPIGRRIDESMPMVDARLKDGSRVNAIIPPLSMQGPMITIRKFSKKMFTTDDLVNFGTVTYDIMKFVEICVKLRKNIVVSGGTGSGKTSFLNIASSFIPKNERIVTIEDSAELQLPHENLGSLEARPANIEGKGEVAIRDLVKNALRMRPDRIVVGECRGGEAIDMLQAMNTGHDGSLTTVHANSTRDSILRLETMVMMSGIELPVAVIRHQISSAVDIIVQLSRLSDGSRKVVCISEALGMKGDQVEINDIFVYKKKGLTKDGKIIGDYAATGYVPSFFDEIKLCGLELSKDIFKE